MNIDEKYTISFCNKIDEKYAVRFILIDNSYAIFVNNKFLFIIANGIVYTKINKQISSYLKYQKTGYPYRCSKLHYIIEFDNEKELNDLIKVLLNLNMPCYSRFVFKRSYRYDMRKIK